VAPGRLRELLELMAHDPALRFIDSGRQLLRWCAARVQEAEARDRLMAAAPAHSMYPLIEFAQCYADGLNAAADQMRARLDGAS
jgi:hypothetical protein